MVVAHRKRCSQPERIVKGLLSTHSGAQRDATLGSKSKIQPCTGLSMLMQLAVGPTKYVPGRGITKTQDVQKKPFVLVVPDISVYYPAMSYSLILVSCCIKAGFTVIHRIPSSDDVKDNGFSLKDTPTIVTPHSLTLGVMKYFEHIWCLPNHPLNCALNLNQLV